MPERVRGTIRDGGRVVFDGELWLESTETSGVTSWHGWFEATDFELKAAERGFTLQLADGRSGQLYITGVAISNGAAQVTFAVTGALR